EQEDDDKGDGEESDSNHGNSEDEDEVQPNNDESDSDDEGFRPSKGKSKAHKVYGEDGLKEGQVRGEDGVIYNATTGQIARPMGEAGRGTTDSHNGFNLREGMGIPKPVKKGESYESERDRKLVALYNLYRSEIHAYAHLYLDVKKTLSKQSDINLGAFLVKLGSKTTEKVTGGFDGAVVESGEKVVEEQEELGGLDEHGSVEGAMIQRDSDNFKKKFPRFEEVYEDSWPYRIMLRGILASLKKATAAQEKDEIQEIDPRLRQFRKIAKEYKANGEMPQKRKANNDANLSNEESEDAGPSQKKAKGNLGQPLKAKVNIIEPDVQVSGKGSATKKTRPQPCMKNQANKNAKAGPSKPVAAHKPESSIAQGSPAKSDTSPPKTHRHNRSTRHQTPQIKVPEREKNKEHVIDDNSSELSDGENQ
ncbi:hypothetical protein FRB99_001002, partial [Tulasnella sp. 403]